MRDARLVRAQRLSGRVTELGRAESRSAVLGLKGGGPDLQGDGVIAERAGRIDPAPRAGVLGVEAVGDALGEGSDRDLPGADGESVPVGEQSGHIPSRDCRDPSRNSIHRGPDD